MERKQITKKQHYITEKLLTEFSLGGRKVAECIIENGRCFTSSTEDAMQERFFYETDFLEMNSLENAFSKVEDHYVPIIKNLVKGMREGTYEANEIYSILAKKFANILILYYRSGAVMEEIIFGMKKDDETKRFQINRLLEIITNDTYLKRLAETMRQGYRWLILESPKEEFVISDQYISTVALSYKNRFINGTNRSIGVIDTMILIPICAKYYLCLFNGRFPLHLKENNICTLSSDEIFKFNRIIYHNAYKKCAGPNIEYLIKLSKEEYQTCEATQVLFGGGKYSGGYTNKKEIFWNDGDYDVARNCESYWSEYKNAIVKYGKGKVRNISCPCGSGQKFKNCCLEKYKQAYEAIEETQRKKTAKMYAIGNCVGEIPIYEFWNKERY